MLVEETTGGTGTSGYIAHALPMPVADAPTLYTESPWVAGQIVVAEQLVAMLDSMDYKLDWASGICRVIIKKYFN